MFYFPFRGVRACSRQGKSPALDPQWKPWFVISNYMTFRIVAWQTWLQIPLCWHWQTFWQLLPHEVSLQGLEQSLPVQPGEHWQPSAVRQVHWPFTELHSAPFTHEQVMEQFWPQKPWEQGLSQNWPKKPLRQVQDPVNGYQNLSIYIQILQTDLYTFP